MNNDGTVVLTGATGFLGAHLLAALVGRKRRVCVLGRSSWGVGLSARIAGLLDWFGLGSGDGLVETLETDLTVAGFGLEKFAYGTLCSKAGAIIHCASDTRFSERKRDEITNANVNGLKGVLALAQDARSPWFHYISTAYAAGTGETFCREKLGKPVKFANVYEETKALAERTVASECLKHGISHTIIRPSIVYGDSVTGRSTRFNALYYHVRSLLNIRDIYLEDILENGGGRSHGYGIRLAEDGSLRLPLRVYLPSRGTVNLIPVDYFVSAVLLILENPQTGDIYHVTTGNPQTMEGLAGYCGKYLNIGGLEIAYGPPPEGGMRNPAEELYNRLIEPYRPYLSDQRTFERSRTVRATGGMKEPELTYGVFEKCMDFAVHCGWKLDLKNYHNQSAASQDSASRLTSP